ncbi:unnamed protein product [Microthlaspi erraticum]|uniref:Uncharacterized protein n=1 Tax=Microthlaspi erraticum TaxID=1685480 RepID=A0A6D2I8Z8_9BRAS|nr:unnamed protein product [Microthlaspi erraticum]
MSILRNALQSLSRWLARKGPREQASSSGAGGFAAEPEHSGEEDLRKILIIYAVLSVYGPNGILIRLVDKRDKEAKEAKEAQNLPK